MKIVKKIESPTAEISLTEDGIGILVDNTEPKTKANFLEIMDAVQEIAGDKKIPFLIDPTESSALTREMRKIAKPIMEKTVSHYAVINANLYTQILTKFFLKVDNLKIPHKVCVNRNVALEWLRSYNT